MGRLIAITSGKGGVGKSSVAANLATVLGEQGHSVLLVDLDAGMRCLDSMLGLSDRLLFDLQDVLQGRKPLEDALLTATDRPNLSFLAAPLSGEIDPQGLLCFLQGVVDAYDFILLDFPAGGVDALYAALPKYTEVLVVCNADPVSVRDAAVMGRGLRALSLMSVRLIINKAQFKRMFSGLHANIDGVIDSSGLQLLAVIPFSAEMDAAACLGKPLERRCRAYKAFNRLVQRLQGFSVPLLHYKKI